METINFIVILDISNLFIYLFFLDTKTVKDIRNCFTLLVNKAKWKDYK